MMIRFANILSRPPLFALFQRTAMAAQNTPDTTAEAILYEAYCAGVRSVQPANIFGAVRFDAATQQLHLTADASISLLAKRCHVFGFGKAALGMAREIKRILGARMDSALISVPMGTTLSASSPSTCRLRVCEGAVNNLPDARAYSTATEILRQCRQLGPDAVAIVLVSGGGSALLPHPIDPVTIVEKHDVCRQLANRQATIGEVNTVRSALSNVKGGRLAVAARNAAALVTLILSDVCGDPLHIIASGPTVAPPLEDGNPAQRAIEVLRKFAMLSEVPESVLAVLNAQLAGDNGPTPPPPVMIANPEQIRHTLLLGNNRIACEAAASQLRTHQIETFVLSTTIQGDVRRVAEAYVRLAEAVHLVRGGNMAKEQFVQQLQLVMQLGEVSGDKVAELFAIVRHLVGAERPLCVICGGEPTVRVVEDRGGRGGRSQELALRVSQLLISRRASPGVLFLAAGTDGVDGPCDVGGAMGSAVIGASADIEAYLADSDSYGFYKSYLGGEKHVRVGPSGTNVMDLHFLLLPPVLAST